MILERGDYFELTRAADRIRLAELALAETQRRYRIIAERLGLEPTSPYRYDDETLSVEILDGKSHRRR